ncbi:MAG: hypothetical protein ACQKBT_01755, partial [Puniceicoccales bacterium]
HHDIEPNTTMAFIGTTLIIIGAIISLVFGLILLVKAFQTSILWGLGYFFIPLVSLIFIIVHWDEAKDPFLKGLLAIPFIVIGLLLLPEQYINQ